MKEISITTKFSAYDTLQDLPIDILNLMQQAISVRKNAYEL